MKKTLSLLTVLIFTFSCSSTTYIRSSDNDASIYVDGNYMGKGSASYTDTKVVGSTTSVRISKKGCEPQMYNFSRSEKLDVGALIGGIFLLVPLLWVMEYNPSRQLEYVCKKE